MSERFTTRTGMMLAMLGMAVGTGNIWRFPVPNKANSADAELPLKKWTRFSNKEGRFQNGSTQSHYAREGFSSSPSLLLSNPARNK